MSAPKIQPVVMDPYDFIDDYGYSRLDHMDGLGMRPDLKAMNLHDAAEYRMAETKHAHPHYKRIGRFDTVAGALVTYTAEQRAEDRFERRMGFAVAGFITLLILSGLIVVGAYIAHEIGVL